MYVLGIETSCDETAAAIVCNSADVNARIRSNIVFSQWNEHQPYGGVVPEIAARAHIRHLEPVIKEALSKAQLSWSEVDAVAATGGPGLIGGVIVGVMMGKTIASVLQKPFIAVNHLEGHALTVRMTNNVAFPFLLLLVSGGHCQFLAVEGVGRYTRLGGTMDDALGEAFDKTAKLLGLGYPGGPAVEALARQGDPLAYHFTVPMKGREGCDFSFSGLKTAIRQSVEQLSSHAALNERQKADLCASFQYTAAQSLIDRTARAISLFQARCPQAKTLVVAGGVAANRYLNAQLTLVAAQHGMEVIAPPLPLCTDNAAMIAWAGLERLKAGFIDSLDFEPRARWPLTELAEFFQPG